jgi:hypothetical protein
MTPQTYVVPTRIMETKTEYQCQYCNRVFRRESTLTSHVCEPRRRFEARGDRGVEIGYQAFLEFYQTLQNNGRQRTQNEFEQSPYYRAFVQFGGYCVNTRVVDPESYMRWLLAHNRRVDRWALDTEYTEYLIEWLPTEPVSQAMRRAQIWAEEWSERNSAPARDCLRYSNSNAVCQAIVAGRVTGWVLYNCASGQDFLGRLQSRDLEMIWPYIDSDRWGRRFRESPQDQALAETLLTDQGW